MFYVYLHNGLFYFLETKYFTSDVADVRIAHLTAIVAVVEYNCAIVDRKNFITAYLYEQYGLQHFNSIERCEYGYVKREIQVSSMRGLTLSNS